MRCVMICLWSADVKLLENQQYVESMQEQVNSALLEYTLYSYPQCLDRFSQLILRLPEVRSLSAQAEDFLCYKHLCGEVPCNNLLIEMLHAKRSTGVWKWHCFESLSHMRKMDGDQFSKGNSFLPYVMNVMNFFIRVLFKSFEHDNHWWMRRSFYSSVFFFVQLFSWLSVISVV